MSLTVITNERRKPDLNAAIEEASRQRFNLGHLAKLLLSLGGEIGKPHADRDSLEWQDLGLRVEYLANQLQDHVEALDEAIDVIDESGVCRGDDQ